MDITWLQSGLVKNRVLCWDPAAESSYRIKARIDLTDDKKYSVTTNMMQTHIGTFDTLDEAKAVAAAVARIGG